MSLTRSNEVQVIQRDEIKPLYTQFIWAQNIFFFYTFLHLYTFYIKVLFSQCCSNVPSHAWSLSGSDRCGSMRGCTKGHSACFAHVFCRSPSYVLVPFPTSNSTTFTVFCRVKLLLCRRVVDKLMRVVSMTKSGRVKWSNIFWCLCLLCSGSPSPGGTAVQHRTFSCLSPS